MDTKTLRKRKRMIACRLRFLRILLFAIGMGLASRCEASVDRYGEYTIDTSISNAYWCTWGWVAPAPSQGASATMASFDFSGTMCAASSSVVPFRREPLKGMIISFR